MTVAAKCGIIKGIRKGENKVFSKVEKMENKKMSLEKELSDLIEKCENANETVISSVFNSIVPAHRGYKVIKIISVNTYLKETLNNKKINLEERIKTGLEIMKNIKEINDILNYNI